MRGTVGKLGFIFVILMLQELIKIKVVSEVVCKPSGIVQLLHLFAGGN